MKHPYLIGKVFNRLTVIEYIGGSHNKYKYKCQCSCENTTTVCASHLTRGLIQSCKCLLSETTSKNKKIHGLSKTKEYKAWFSMLQRCTNKTHFLYATYGFRGITVCKQWLDFISFHKDMGICPEYHSLERIDNDKGYSKENCKWATKLEQANNTRRNHKLTFKDKTLSIAAWARETGIVVQTIHARLIYGWSVERTLTENIN